MSQALCQCDLPPDAAGIDCPRHAVYKPRRLVELCNAGARGESPADRYWTAWEEGRGPGQPGAAAIAAIPRHGGARLLAQIRAYVLSRRPLFDPNADLDKTLQWMNARPWPQIEQSARICATCPECTGRLCRRFGSSCQDRQRWLRQLLTRSCEREEELQRTSIRRLETPFVTIDDLQRQTRTLVGRLPPTITDVVGIARSGLIPATILACLIHRPLWSLSTTGLNDLGTTYRLQTAAAPPAKRHALLLDDTAFKGGAMRRFPAILREHWPDAQILRAVVYSTPAAKRFVDLSAAELPPPHYLEWHWSNSPLAHACWDFDGLLCEDCLPEDDDDGPRYEQFLATARPRYYARHTTLPLVVTARLDRPRYRELTQNWLRRHGIRCDRLVMGPWGSLQERAAPLAVERFKSAHYRQSKLRLFIESDARQARVIARLAQKPVLCPAAGVVY